MKRIGLSFLAVILIAVAAYAATNVTSVNVVGYTKFQAPGSDLVLKAIPFDAFDQTLKGVFGTNQLKQGTSKGQFTVADNIYIWDPSVPGYTIYAQDSDGQFYDTDDWGGTPVTDAVMTAGTAFWLRSAEAEGTTNEITVMGEVVDVETQSVDIVEGLQLISYGFSSGIGINETDFVNDGAKLGTSKGQFTVADTIYVWDPESGFTLYAPDETGTWYNTDDWQGAPVSNILEVGTGFWYLRQAGSGTMIWSETNKYLNNLR